MANGTPSQSFKLGADLLEQMGDLKGAAKALGDEAKDAQKEVRDAEKALKDLEKRKAKGEKVDTTAAFETLQAKQARAEGLRQRSADLKEQDKQRRKDQKEWKDSFSSSEKRTQKTFFNIKDNIDGVAKSLLSADRGAASNAAGSALLKVSGAITEEGAAKVSRGISAVARTGALIAGPALIADKVSKTVFNLIQADVRKAESQGQISEGRRQFFRQFIGRTGAEAETTEAELLFKQADVNAKILAKKITGFDPDSFMGKIFGASDKEIALRNALTERVKKGASIREMFGIGFELKTDPLRLLNDPAVNREVRDEIQRQIGGSAVTQLARWSSGAVGSLADLVGLDPEAVSNRFLSQIGQESDLSIRLRKALEQADKELSGRIQEREEKRREIESNPVFRAERHSRTTRFAGLEAQRIKRQMAWAKI
jgi:hypothetical protein